MSLALTRDGAATKTKDAGFAITNVGNDHVAVLSGMTDKAKREECLRRGRDGATQVEVQTRTSRVVVQLRTAP